MPQLPDWLNAGTLNFALMWMVLYGLLVFGWTRLREIHKAEGGLLFAAVFYAYSAALALGMLYTLGRLALAAYGIDTSFLDPAERIVGSVASLVQITGVALVVVAIILYINRYLQSRRARRGYALPSQPAAARAPKRKHSKGQGR